MGFIDKLGNAITGNGFRSTDEIEAENWRNAQEQALRKEREEQQHSAMLVNQYANMNTGDMLKNLMQNDANNSSAWMNTFVNYKMNSPEQKMADLKKAGINPLLAVNGGTTFESSPQVSTALAQQDTREQKIAQTYEKLQMKREQLGLQKEAFILNTALRVLNGGAENVKGPFGIGLNFAKF